MNKLFLIYIHKMNEYAQTIWNYGSHAMINKCIIVLLYNKYGIHLQCRFLHNKFIYLKLKHENYYFCLLADFQFGS